MTRRPALILAATLAGTVMLAGCGGGGSGSAGADAPPPPVATPEVAAAPVPSSDELYGSLGVVDPGADASSLTGYDELGAPRDAFAQLVRNEAAGGSPSEATIGGGSPVSAPVAPTPAAGAPVVAVPGGTSAPPTAPASPTTPTTPPANPVSGREASFDIGGEPVVARVGDAMPPATQQFTVSEISATSVTLKLNGGLLPDGTDSVKLREGESVTLDNQTAGTSYTVKLLTIRTA